MNRVTNIFFQLKLIIVFSILFSSCETEYQEEYGIAFAIENSTNSTYENSKVIIGGINSNNEFIEVDYYMLPKIEEGSQGFLNEYIGSNRWKPDFNKIKLIGDGKAYFKFQFEGKEAKFIEFVNNPNLEIFIDLNKYDVLYDNGLLDINIDNDSRFDRNDDMVYGYNYATALSLDELESNIKGLKFEILNDSQNDFINPQVIIGGIDLTGQFIEVDNYSLSTIEKYSFENLLYSGSGQNRWKPDFERIKTIGTGKAYFKFKYDNNPASFINYEHHDWPDIYNHIMYIDLKDFEVIGCYGLLKIIIDNTNKIHVRNCAMYESVRDTN
ncbi:hypothetical protein [Tenacibaculum piscium]|uniref:hypothetical protein n=1 Tax=Tenacibaculum piscium TaxID=1458515 RepID=UPI001BEA1170|nr:hypothetical protein [Tenacibaculum piscium]